MLDLAHLPLKRSRVTICLNEAVAEEDRGSEHACGFPHCRTRYKTQANGHLQYMTQSLDFPALRCSLQSNHQEKVRQCGGFPLRKVIEVSEPMRLISRPPQARTAQQVPQVSVIRRRSLLRASPATRGACAAWTQHHRAKHAHYISGVIGGGKHVALPVLFPLELAIPLETRSWRRQEANLIFHPSHDSEGETS